jgi:uncharacterized protein
MAHAPSEQELAERALEMYLGTDEGKFIQQRALEHEAAKAGRPLKVLAVLHLLFAAFFFARFHQLIVKGDPTICEVGTALMLCALGYCAVWGWSISNPLAAAVTGLLLYTSAVFVGLVTPSPSQAHLDAQGGVIAHTVAGCIIFVFVGLLSQSIMYGSRQRRLAIADAESKDGVAAPVRPGIASAIWLYLCLLAVVLIPRVLLEDRQATLFDQLRVHVMFAFVIVAWGIASWRIVLPACKRWPEAKWFAQAIILGVATSLLGMIWLRFAHAYVNVPIEDLVSPLLRGGLNWVQVVGIICVFPAVFEELAFRGIIVPVLHRALNKWETILASGAMFMILHLSPFSFPHLLCLGIALGYVRLRTGSIWPCVLMHFTHNLMCLWLT